MTMNKQLEAFSLLAYLLPVICSFCYGLMLIFRRESRVKQVMGFMMLMASLCYATSLLYDSMVQQDGRVPILNAWHMGSSLMISPIVGWYFTLLVRPDAKFFPRFTMFLSPFFISIIVSSLFATFAEPMPNVYTIKDYMVLVKHYPEASYRLVLTIIFIAELIILPVGAELQLKKHRERIKNDFSYTEKVDLSWVHVLILLCAVCGILNLVYAFSSAVHVRTIYNMIFFVLLLIFCITGGLHPDIYYVPKPTGVNRYHNEIPLHASLFIPPGQEKAKIAPPMYRKIHEGITHLLEEQEIYCNPNLRLDDIADMLNTNKTYVSIVINELFQTNFYTLINRYRIKKAIGLIEKRDFSIKDVSAKSGFNSQSVFCTVFKKEMKVTPLEWTKRVKNEK